MSGNIQQGYAIGHALVELVGIDEQLAASAYCGSVEIPIDVNGQASGEILSVALIARESGSGAVLASQGKLYLFDADPAIALGATALAADGAEHRTIVGVQAFATADWVTDTNGAVAFKQVAWPFARRKSLWAAFFLNAAETTINSAAGDDEILELRLHWRRDQ